MIVQFAPAIPQDVKHLDRWLSTLRVLLPDSVNPFKRGETFGLEFYSNPQKLSYYCLLPAAQEELLLHTLRSIYPGSGFKEQIHRPLPTPSDTLYALGLRDHPFRTLQLRGMAFHDQLREIPEVLQKGEEVFGQILFEPVCEGWQENYAHVYQDYLDSGETISGMGIKRLLSLSLKRIADAPRQMIQQEREKKMGKLKETEEKLKQAGFRVCVRLAIRAQTARISLLKHMVLMPFRSMTAENEWQYANPSRRHSFLTSWQAGRVPHLSVPILCEDEVRSFFILSKVLGKVEGMTPEERKTDERITKTGIQIGHTYAFGRKGEAVYYVTQPTDDLVRQRLYIAPPGGGKTTQIYILWHQMAKLGYGGALWDVADGSLYTKALQAVPEEQQKKIVAIDHTHEKYPPVFNFSALAGAGEDASQMFAELFDVLFAGENLTRSRAFMQKCAMSAFAFPEHQFLEFILLMREEGFRKKLLPSLRSKYPDLYLWWIRDFPRISAQELQRMTAPILDRCDQLLYNPRLKPMMNGRGGRQTPRQWMDQGMLVHYNLSGGRFSEQEQRIIMAMYNQAYWSATLSREDVTKKGIRPRPFFLIYDEPQTYINATPMFKRAISKARKYSVSCNFFIQDSEQVIEENKSFWLELLGVKPHLMIGHIGETTARHLLKEFRGMSVEQLLEVEKYEHTWWLKTYADKKAVEPILVKALDTTTISWSDPTLALQRSIQKYAPQSAEQINEEISARNLQLSLQEYRDVLASYNQEGEVMVWGESEKGGANEDLAPASRMNI